MPLLGFKREHIEPIRKGWKRQTIRKVRKYPIQPGEILLMWTGLRTKNTEKIGQYICRSVTPIEIHVSGYIMDSETAIDADDHYLLNRFANLDGFKTWEDLVRFFEGYYELPFEGVVICW